MSKLDLTKLYKAFYSSKRKPNIIDVPTGNFISIPGRGSPDSEGYKNSVGALYNVAYPLKFKAKAMGNDYVVCKLEGLWWFDNPDATDTPREEWNWRMMIRQPDFITPEMLAETKAEVHAKKGNDRVLDVVFEAYNEGLCAQIMHIGPYADEEPTIATLHDFIDNNGYKKRGLHHEIYLSNPERTTPEKMKTIIRQPIEYSVK